MSDTPRTDAEIIDPEVVHQDSHSEGWVSIEFARQLERELNEARNRLSAMDAWFNELDVLEDNPTSERKWGNQIGWIPPGCAVYIGSLLKLKEETKS